MKTHDNQKPFQCTVCNRGYNTAAALTSHMQNHKKQIALTGSPTLTYSSRYSPRSTGSASSATSLTPKRRPESVGNSAKSPLDFMNFPKSSNPLTCLYCTKSDFTSLDQLHSHIQAMHGGLMKTELSPLPAITSPSFGITCEFCTIKCPTVQTLLSHVRSTHLDKINVSPNSYLEQFKAAYNYSPRLRVQNGQDEVNKIKAEDKSPQSVTTPTPTPTPNVKIEGNETEEEQTSPTDLSQPRSKKQKLDESTNSSDARSPSMAPGTFLCNQCTAALPDFDSFRAHLKSHLEIGHAPLCCQTCGMTFSDQGEYETHIVSHFLITSSEFACAGLCNKSYSKPDELQKHLFDLHCQMLFKCSLCAEVFDTKVAIQVHFAVAHSNEQKIFRCSSCSETFKVEREFRQHIRTRHLSNGAVQCVFCHMVCTSELEMHFHLASHAKQFKCPACPESFHVEFLLDRHIQTHHSQKEVGFQGEQKSPINNNTLDYHHPYSAQLAKNPLYGFSPKFYNPLQVDTINVKHTNHLFQGLYDSMAKSQRFLHDAQKNYLSPNKINMPPFNAPRNFSPENGPRSSDLYSPGAKSGLFSPAIGRFMANNSDNLKPPPPPPPRPAETKMFSCGICERNDFSTENEAHTHRKISHNLKTGVSLRCAYCNGDFRSRYVIFLN